MATIKFKNPFLNQDGSINTTHDDLMTPGVYIVGVKIPVSDPPQFDEKGQQIKTAVEKFCPLYVGIRNDLRVRITGHRNRDSSRGELNYSKELFDLEVNGNVNKLYNSISELLKFRDNTEKNHMKGHSPIKCFPVLCHKCAEELVMFQKLKKNKNRLIWYPNPAFFEININSMDFKSVYKYHDSGKNGNYNHKKSIEKDLKHDACKNLIQKINRTKEIIQSNFWYAYVTLDDIVNAIPETHTFLYKKANEYREAIESPDDEVRKEAYNSHGKSICESVENATKKALEEKGIFTYAKANKVKEPYEIDFTELAKDLVNMKCLPFNNNKNPLIINIIP